MGIITMIGFFMGNIGWGGFCGWLHAPVWVVQCVLCGVVGLTKFNFFVSLFSARFFCFPWDLNLKGRVPSVGLLRRSWCRVVGARL